MKDWSNHIDLVCKRSTKMMGILRKVCPLIHPSAHLTLYYSFLFPYLNYCNLVWAASYPNHLKKWCIIQKRFLRFISHSNRYAPSAPLFINYSILPIHKLNIYQICLFIHKFIYRNQDLPESFQSLFTHSFNVHSHRTRHSNNNNLSLPFSRTSHHRFSMSYRGPALWNVLPPLLRSISSHSLFKKQLKKHLSHSWIILSLNFDYFWFIYVLCLLIF